MNTAVIADGGFVLPNFKRRLQKLEDPEMAGLVHQWLATDLIKIVGQKLGKDLKLFRAHYYDCYPFQGTIVNPINGFVKEARETNRTRFLDELATLPFLSLKTGRLIFNGWKIKDSPKERFDKINCSYKTEISRSDFQIEPNFKQKEVDILIAMDVLQIIHEKMVKTLIFVTADSDFAPLMEEARNNGILVVLVSFEKRPSQALLSASDFWVDSKESPDLLAV